VLEQTLKGPIQADIDQLRRKNAEYGGSWIRRGGVGAFMMLARKWDRFEQQMAGKKDLRQAIAADHREEGLLDDIGDLRRYLMLVEAYTIAGDRYMDHLALLDWNGATLESYACLQARWDALEKTLEPLGYDVFDKSDGEVLSLVHRMRKSLYVGDVAFGAADNC
jgi:hypothetical protein